jgi:hypothetical protein
MTSMRQPQTRPKRIQLSRKRGWRMPENTVKVGRPTRWGNPFVVGKDGDAAECVRKYQEWCIPYRHVGTMASFLESEATLGTIIAELRGKNLACWCPLNQPCHADVLLQLANAPLGGEEASN